MKEKLIEFLELEKAVIPEPWVATKFGDEIGVYQGPIKKQRGSLSYKATICILEDPDISDLPTVRLRQLAEFIAQSRTVAPLAARKLLEAVELLAKVEWVFDNDWGYYYCPICRSEKQYGHQKDCKLKKLLEDFNND